MGFSKMEGSGSEHEDCMEPEVPAETDKCKDSNVSMQIEDDDEVDIPLREELLNKLRVEASRSFFEEYGLISHQINSYNDFVDNGIQKLFDSIGEIKVEPSYAKKPGKDGWKRGRVRFGKVKLEKPMFWTGDKYLKFLPKHARLQRMTYSSRMKLEIHFQAFTLVNESSDKYKTGKESEFRENIIHEDKKKVVIGRFPVMVRSNLCWLEGKKKGDCEFDNGGYFVIKGAEKVFVAQEQLCLKRLWVSDKSSRNIAYRHEWNKLRVVIRVEDIEEPKHLQGTKILNVYFLSCKIPLWIFLFALGMSSDKEIFEMINICERDASSVNLLTSTIGYADYQYEGFRGGNNLKRIGEWISDTKKPPKESTRECIDMFLFPSLKSLKLKSLFLLYMVKCLLQSYSGKRQCDNRDDFRNKWLDLAGELLERELHSHVKHAERTMVIRIQKALDGNKDLNPIDYYFDASVITNGLNRAFSTGGWSHHLKRENIWVVVNLR